MKQNKYTAPEGSCELLFSQCQVRNKTIRQISEQFVLAGYNEVVTPTLEFYDLFNEKDGISQREMYTLTDLYGRILVMRPESTKPIARLVSSRLRNQPMPLRLFYNLSKFQRNSLQKKKRDEILQMGAELVGTNSKNADLEMLTLAIDCLTKVEPNNLVFEISHIGLFQTLISGLKVENQIKREIIDCIAFKKFSTLETLLTQNNIDNQKLLMLPKLFGTVEIIKEAESIFEDKKSREILAYLRDICTILERIYPSVKIVVDCGLANNYSYYTDIVFKGYTQNGEVLSGGRYDKLYEEFDLSYPSIGFAIDIDILAKSQKVSKKTAKKHSVTDFEKDYFLAKEKKEKGEIVVYDY